MLIPIEGLRSYNEVPVIYNVKDRNGSFAIVGGQLEGFGAASSRAAIWNQKSLYMRDVVSSGYNQLINNDDKGRDCGDLADGLSGEHHSHCNVHSLFDLKTESLSLPVKPTPMVSWDDPSTWVSVMDYGAVGDGTTNDVLAVQAALSSGATTMYFPGGRTFRIDGMVTITGPVRRVIGLRGRLAGNATFIFDDSGTDNAPVVVFERFVATYAADVYMEHRSDQTLVMNDIAEITPIGKGAGDLFINDIMCHNLELTNPAQHAWCWQFNVETFDKPKITNDDATLWMLGVKTERGNTVIQTLNGGRTELMGGMIYSTNAPKTHPMFVIKDAQMSIQGVSERNSNGNFYQEWMRETRGSETRVLDRADVKRGNSWYIGIPLNAPTNVPVSSISISGPTEIAVDGGTAQLTADVLPANATDATYTWSLQGSARGATVSATGFVTASSENGGNGTITVRATAQDGPGTFGEHTITLTNQASDLTTDTQPPSKPTLSVDNTTSTSVVLTWNAATNNLAVTTYQLYQERYLADYTARGANPQ